MEKWFVILWVFATGILLSGCDYTDAWTKDGQMIKKEIDVEAFENVEIATSVLLVLANDTIHKAEVEGLDFILSRLIVSQKDKEILIESEGSVSFRKKQMPVVTLSSPRFKKVISNFASEISCADTLKVNNLRVIVNGKGSFTECDLTLDAGTFSFAAYGSNVGSHLFKGKADNVKIISEGLCTVDALELNAEEVFYDQRSVNPGYVFAREKVTVEMNASGDVFYSGTSDTSVIWGSPLYEVKLGELINIKQ